MEPTNTDNDQHVDVAPMELSRSTGSPSSGDQGLFNAEEYLRSFSALKDSMAMGRDLKKKRKALEEYKKTLATLETAYQDRLNIAQNSESIVREQEHIIDAVQSEIAQTAKKLESAETRIEESNRGLAELKQAQLAERKPLIEELDLRNAELASAKDELKQVKAQRDSLDLFQEGSAEVAASEATHDAVVQKVNDKYEAAKAAQRAAQKALDAREKDERAKQKRALDAIKQLTSEKESFAKQIDELEKKVSAAKERIAFVGYVLEHPSETDDMRQRIESNRKTAYEMDQQINRLSSVHERRKAAAGKARAVVIGVLVLIVVVAVLIFNLTR